MDVTELKFVKQDGDEERISICSLRSSEYAYYTWKSAELLSQTLFSGQINLAGLRVLELGSGTGLCGICAAKAGASSVTFSDVDDDKIKENIQRNCSLNGISNYDFVVCDWNEIPLSVLDKSFDVILASDCLFDNKVVQPFTEVLSLILHKNRNAKAYIAYEDRGSNVDLLCAFERVHLSLSHKPSDAFDRIKYYLFESSVLAE